MAASRLAPAQQRVLGAVGRDGYDSWPVVSRDAFEQVTRALTALVLSDPENGEVLGSALDLVDSMEQPARADATSSPAAAWRVPVALAPGARDALRRSAEFTLDTIAAGSAPVYVHRGAASIRITMTGPAAALIAIDLTP